MRDTLFTTFFLNLYVYVERTDEINKNIKFQNSQGYSVLVAILLSGNSRPFVSGNRNVRPHANNEAKPKKSSGAIWDKFA
jgi:hypothetical protein